MAGIKEERRVRQLPKSSMSEESVQVIDDYKKETWWIIEAKWISASKNEDTFPCADFYGANNELGDAMRSTKSFSLESTLLFQILQSEF